MEILLIDWIPRKIVGPAEYLSLAPELLRAFIRFAHAEVGVRPELTHESLAAIDDYEPEYQQTIRSPRPQGPAALLAAMGVDVGNATGMDFGTNESGGFGQMILDTLAREVGDRDALDQLDDFPLLDEAFGWEGLDDDGTMRTILRRRVLTGLAAAQFFPQSSVIVTGGDPQTAAPTPASCAICLFCLDFRPTDHCRRPRQRAVARDAISPFVNVR